MRKIITAIAMSLCVAAHAQVENIKYWDYNDVGWWTTTEDPTLITDTDELWSKGRGFTGDGITVSYDMSLSLHENAFFMRIENKTDSTITVKWSKSQIDGQRIVTGNGIWIQEREKAEEDDYIYPNQDIKRYVSSTSLVSTPYARPLDPYDYKRNFKKTKKPQQGKTDVTLCMEVGGQEKIYHFTLHAIYNGKR